MSELPSEIRKKIEENADAYSTDPFQRQDYYMGACDCYRLAQEEIDKLEQTVGSLEGLVKTLEHEIESLRKENEELRDALRKLWNRIENGSLVRNTSDDGSPDFSSRMLTLVMELKEINNLLKPLQTPSH